MRGTGDARVARKLDSRPDVIGLFTYPELPDPAIPDWELWGGGALDDEARAETIAIDAHPDAAAAADFEERLAEETRRSFEAGRAQGIEQGRIQERTAQGAAQQRLAAQIERLVVAFALERDHYLHAAESEVVKLALAIAARILRREAQMDPLLLTGAVRVALGQLAANTAATLRVPPTELALWEESIALLPNLAVNPRVAPGEGMRLGDCILETSLGTVDLGVRAQLGEIERGFFDRAAAASSNAELANAEMALAAAELRS